MIRKNELKIASLITVLFLIGGAIHVIAGPWDFTSCIAQIYYSSLMLVWAVTIYHRIVNPKVRQLMLMTVGLFLLAFFLQMSRYRVFESFKTASRYFWYGYYVSILLIPVLFLFVILNLHLQENEKMNRYWLLMLIPSLLFILLVMTNDLHQLIFIFTKGSGGQAGTYDHSLVFYGIYVWIIIVLVLTLYLAIRKCRIPNIGKKLWMPLYFAAFGILDILGMFDIPKISGVTVWLLVECLAMTIIGMEESCIQLGLISANSSYRMIASRVNKPFIISDECGTPIYKSEAAQELFQKQDHVQIYTKQIRGGQVSWAVDLSDRIALNQEIEKVTESIESRNEYLQNENFLKEEQSRLNARNTLYNQIAEIVSPQLNAIEQLLRDPVDDHHLARISFLNAYIKRRSNMELLRSDQKHFPTEELTSAIRESCEYLKLCGVNAMLHITPECELSAELQLFLYETFEKVIEQCFHSLKFLLVNITLRQERAVLRMSMKADKSDISELERALSEHDENIYIDFETDEDEVTLTISRVEGEVDI